MKNILAMAYESENPQSMLIDLTAQMVFTSSEVEYILGQLHGRMELTHACGTQHPQYEVLDDLVKFDEQPKKCTEESYRCKFVYFATSIPHIWGTLKNNGFYLTPLSTIMVYLNSNHRAIPYIWLHIQPEKENMVLMRHTLTYDGLFKVMMIVFTKPSQNVDYKRIAFDLNSQLSMPSSKGIYLQITIRKDTKTCFIPKSGATSACSCAVILTCNLDYELQHVYYNDGVKKRIHELISVIHGS